MQVRKAILESDTKPRPIPLWTRNMESICGLTYALQEPEHPTVYIRVDIIDEKVVSS